MTEDRTATDIWVIGFPKSGNTWISYLSSYCLNLPFNNFGNPTANQKRTWVKELTSGGQPWAALKGYGFVQKTHRSPDQVPVDSGLVIYAIRDPRDTFVSYNYFMKGPHANLLGRVRYFLLGLFGKELQIRWFIKQWKTHLDQWQQRSEIILSYDKLLLEGPQYLCKTFCHAPFDVPEEIVKQAYETFSFKNMSGGRKPGSEDKGSFFRKGISGDWRNHFSAEEIKVFNNALDRYEQVIG